MTRSSKNPLHRAERLTTANPSITTVREYFGPYSAVVNGPKVGIEVEIETSNDLYMSQRKVREGYTYWDSVTDGSLRNSRMDEQGGRELLFRQPTDIKNVPSALTELDDILSKGRSKIRKSNRTSVHVHYNVQDFTLSKLMVFFCLYYTVEPILCRFNSFERENNLFALQATKSDDIIQNLEYLLRNRAARTATKYSALNFMPLLHGRFGTVEFRAGQGIESSAQEILPWVDLIAELMNACDAFKSPVEIITALSTEGILRFIQRIMPKVYRAGEDLFQDEDLETILTNAMRNSQSLAYDIDWGDYTPEKSTPKKSKKFRGAYLTR